LGTKQGKIHRGEILDAAVRNSSFSITAVAKKLKISRRSYYNHIADPNLSWDQLEEYGKALKYDFSQDIPEMKKYVFEEPEARYGRKPENLEQALQHIDYWKAKYYQLLEDLHKSSIQKGKPS
jgi:hypothetical protein